MAQSETRQQCTCPLVQQKQIGSFLQFESFVKILNPSTSGIIPCQSSLVGSSIMYMSMAFYEHSILGESTSMVTNCVRKNCIALKDVWDWLMKRFAEMRPERFPKRIKCTYIVTRCPRPKVIVDFFRSRPSLFTSFVR
jgi:hypothetical protein